MAIRAAVDNTRGPTDREILGYSRYVVFAAAFISMAVISPYEYAWSSIPDTSAGSITGPTPKSAGCSRCL